MTDRRANRYPLELSADEMRSMAEEAARRIVEHVDSLPRQPAAEWGRGEEVARFAREEMPVQGRSFEELMALVFDRLVPESFNTAGPGYLAYIPGGGLYHSAVADFVAGAVNRYVGVWLAAPGLVQLEANVIRWFCEMVGYPAAAGGFLTSGGSLANLTGIVTARREKLPENFLNGTLYASDQVHHSVVKAASIAGFPRRSVRRIATDERFRIRMDELEARVAEDRAAGKAPFLVVGSAGTTNTGAVDDLEALADLAEAEELWLHLDAAYGGFFTLTERGRRRLRGIDRADSITLDPHKGLFLPYGTGCLLAREQEALRRAHTSRADYMPPFQDSTEWVDFCEISPELSRDFRGLRVWLPLAMHGVGAFRDALDEKLDLAEWVTSELESLEEIEIVAQPQLSIVAFRLRRPELSAAELDRLNREFLDRINRPRNVYLTGTILNGAFVLRICVLSFRTHRSRMEMALADVGAALATL